MNQYHNLLKHVLKVGTYSDDRTNTGTISVFGAHMEFNLRKGFPLVTTKRVPFRYVLGELLWFLNGGKGGIKALRKNYGCTIWDEWEHLENADTYVPYGAMWRKWEIRDSLYSRFKRFLSTYNARLPIIAQWRKSAYIDQIETLINELKNNPYSRRHILTAWNVGELANFVLPPCHFVSVFEVRDKTLSCHLHLRSNDLFLGAPFNIASYAILTHILAKVCGYKVGKLVYTISNAHIYSNHIEQVNLQLSRECRELPKLEIVKPFNIITDNPIEYIESLTFDDFVLTGYNPHPTIKAPVAV